MTVYKLHGRVYGVMAVIIVVAFIIFLSQFYNTNRDVDINFHLPQNKDLKFQGESQSGRDLYSIVFDAGSTGSRVHILQFTVPKPGSSLKLIKETFEQEKPGLSSYADDPHMAAMSLDNMLKLCLKIVPKHLHNTTSITLKATAGLRLLSEGTADNILNEVKVLFRSYPFLLPDNGIGIMDGVDEGVFSWMTVNFVLGLLSDNKETVAALDLGGGSTQITFVPKSQATIQEAPQGYVQNISLFRNTYRLYTHSYLGLGLMSARFSSTGGDAHKDEDISSFALSGPCIQPGYNGTWSFGGKDYKLRGAASGEFQYEKCAEVIRQLVQKQVQPIKELSSQQLYVFSYFFDAALEANLIKPDGGVIQLKDYEREAKQEFLKPTTGSPFKAFDLLYSYTVLHHGYSILEETKLILVKQINHVEVSWALGAAFQLMSSVGQAR